MTAERSIKDSNEPPRFNVIAGSGPSPRPALDGDAVGRLRRELIWTMGEQRTHGIFARIGLSRGHADFAEHGRPEPAVPASWGRLRAVEPKTAIAETIFEVDGSLEADEHRRLFGQSRHPQCWMMAGYLTGYLRLQNVTAIYFIETRCAARGDAVCRFVGKKKSGWGSAYVAALELFEEDNMAAELTETRNFLRQTRDRYQNLFEQASVPIVILHPETGVYLEANVAASELTGFEREELLEMNIFDLRPREEHHDAANYLKGLAAGERIPRHDMTLIRKDGARRIVWQSSKLLTYGGERVIQVAMRDVTDLKEAEQTERDLNRQLIRSERLSSIGRLAAGVAHELKNPLGAIRNALYYIRSAIANTEVAERDLQLGEILSLAESEVDSSVRIIGELLDFSRVVELMPRSTQLNDMLEQIPKTISIPHNVELEFDLDVALPSVQADPDRLKQVFANIVTNAVHAMPEGGRLTIRSRLEIESGDEDHIQRDFVLLSFEDTGKGIEQVHLKKVFEPLFTTKARGTGLGLSISGNIIDKHGGTIQVTSQVGKGTTFRVKLPLKPPEPQSD